MNVKRLPKRKKASNEDVTVSLNKTSVAMSKSNLHSAVEEYLHRLHLIDTDETVKEVTLTDKKEKA